MNIVYNSVAYPRYHTKERRAGFSSVHFQKEKIFKKIDKAILQNNVSNLQDVLQGLDLTDFEDSAYDWMFLKRACEMNALDMAAVLLRHNADANHYGNSSVLPLHVAVRKGNLAMCALLLSKGAKVSTVTKYEHRSALHFAVLGGHARIAQLLLEFKHDINIKDIYGDTPLHAACRLGRNAIIQDLLDKNASVDAYDKEGWTGLHVAAEAGHTTTVSLLLDHNVNINAQNIYGRTPLSWACSAGHVTVVQELLKRGADANIKDHNNKQAYQHAYNESIQKLVLLHTSQQTEPFYSTIGILVQIDPRQKMSKSSASTLVNVLQLWQPLQSKASASSTGSAKEVKTTKTEKEKGGHTSHKLHGSLSLIPEDGSLDTTTIKIDKQKAFVSAYKELSEKTKKSLASLEAELESVGSFIKMSKNASLTSKNEIVQNMQTCVTNLIHRVEQLQNSCGEEFERTLTMYKDSWKEKSVIGEVLGIGYISVVNLFCEIMIDYISSEEDGWQVFLKHVPLPSDLRNTLLIKMNLENSSQAEKTRYLINYWTRNGEAFLSTREKTLFMKSALAALKKCDFCEDEDGIRMVTTKLFKMSQNFKTGKHKLY